MRHKYFPLKVIHWDTLQSLSGQGWVDGRLTPYYEVYPKTPDNELPVLFRWTYRLHKDNNDILFSYIGESKYLLIFDFHENPKDEIAKLIDNSHLQFDIHFQQQTVNTPLQGYTTAHPTDQQKHQMAEEIIEIARQEGLLQ